MLAGSVIDTYFRGELSALRAIAGSPTVVERDTPAMARFFRSLQSGEDRAFSAGLGWIDAEGVVRVSSTPGVAARRLDGRGPLLLLERDGEREAVRERGHHQPHRRGPRDRHGGTDERRGRAPDGRALPALLRRPFAISNSSLDLGGAGVTLLDRAGRSILSGTPNPSNSALARSLQGTGIIADTRGLDGSGHHAVAHTNSAIPGWTIVIDEPRSVLFADARRGFFLELALVTAAASIVLFLIGFILIRGRRGAERERARARQRRDWRSSSAARRSAARSRTASSPASRRRSRARSASSRWRRRTTMASRSRQRPRASSRRARPLATSWSRRQRRSPTSRGRRS